MNSQPSHTTYFIFKDAIVVNTGDQTFTIAKSDPRFQDVLTKCLGNQLDKLCDLSSDARKLKSLLGLGD